MLNHPLARSLALVAGAATFAVVLTGPPLAGQAKPVAGAPVFKVDPS